jgi:hypothetical protein
MKDSTKNSIKLSEKISNMESSFIAETKKSEPLNKDDIADL